MPPTTTQRGYGWTHQQARAAAIAHLRKTGAQPCARNCGKPVLPHQARHLDLDHTDDRTGYRGLAHRTCNRRAGQAKAQANRRTRSTKPQRSTRTITSRAW